MKKASIITCILLFLSILCLFSCNDTPEVEKGSDGLYYTPHYVWKYDKFGKYVETDEIEYYTVSLGGCVESDIVIPSTHAGKPVKHLDENSFKNNEKVVSFTYNSNITEIGRELNGCKNLTKVTIGSNVDNIHLEAFFACDSLSSIEVSDKNTSFTSQNGILYSKSKDAIIRVPQGKNLTSFTVTSNITRIGDGAFSYSASLKEISLPSTLKGIGEYAFSYCVELDSISLPTELNYISEGAFVGTKLTSIRIPDGINQLGDGVFAHCSSLTSVTLPSSTVNIGSYFFYNCTSLESIGLPSSVQSIGHSAFEGCSKLQTISSSSVTELGSACFKNCSSLASVNIGNTLKAVGENAFENCDSLTEISLKESVISIGDYAFIGCDKLKSITVLAAFEDDETKLGKNIFENCPALCEASVPCKMVALLPKEQIITANITDGKLLGGFLGFNALVSVTVSDKVGGIDDNAFISCQALKEIALGKVSSIGANAFKECVSLESITIPSTVKEISSSTFRGCSSLSSVIIENGASAIGSSAFSGCSSLKEILIPASVTEIGSYAFNECISLEKIELLGTSSIIKEYTFFGCVSLYELEIPEGVTKIENNAIRNCTSLVKLTLPSTLTSGVSVQDTFKLVEVYNLSSASLTVWNGGNYDKWPRVIHTSKNETSVVETVDDFVFATIEEKIYLVGYVGKETKIDLPSSYNGSTYTVRSGAFANESLTCEITITDGVYEICGGAFYSATSITDIIFKETTNWKYYDGLGNQRRFPLNVENSSNNAQAFCSSAYLTRYVIKEEPEA